VLCLCASALLGGRLHTPGPSVPTATATMPTLNIAGVSVDFPFEPYPVQLVYMEKVIMALDAGENALLESPTGTGKTLCLLCAALGWRRAEAERIRAATSGPSGGPRGADWVDKLRAQVAQPAPDAQPRRVPRVIYASRTHSQLQQVVRELRRTAHRPLVCLLGSREQMCVHHEVSKLKGAAQSSACAAHVVALSCSYHRRLKEAKQRAGGTLPHPELGKPEDSRAVPDIEDFVDRSKKDQLCPFYLSRELQRESEVLFVPYNYLVESEKRSALNIELARDILIFDEAHNIESVRTAGTST